MFISGIGPGYDMLNALWEGPGCGYWLYTSSATWQWHCNYSVLLHDKYPHITRISYYPYRARAVALHRNFVVHREFKFNFKSCLSFVHLPTRTHRTRPRTRLILAWTAIVCPLNYIYPCVFVSYVCAMYRHYPPCGAGCTTRARPIDELVDLRGNILTSNLYDDMFRCVWGVALNKMQDRRYTSCELETRLNPGHQICLSKSNTMTDAIPNL